MKRMLKKAQLIIAGILAIIMLTASMPYSLETAYCESDNEAVNPIYMSVFSSVFSEKGIEPTAMIPDISSLNLDYMDEIFKSVWSNNGVEQLGVNSASATVSRDIPILDEDGHEITFTAVYNVTEASTLFSDVEVWDSVNDFPAYYKTYLDMLIGQQFPNATKLATATVSYNCHYYAWFNGDDSYWYDSSNPQTDFSDGSCVEVTSPSAGDIICYFDANGNNIHSGVVVSVSSGTSNRVCGNSNLVTVKSKWGTAGLYQHRGDQCPYTSTYGGSAVSVKYYHRNM